MSSNYCNVQLHQDLYAWVSMLPNQQDPMAFLKLFTEALQLANQAQQRQSEAHQRMQTEAETEERAKAETAAKNRLVAIIIKHAENQGISKYNLPTLKQKSYRHLCQYVEDEWPELISYI